MDYNAIVNRKALIVAIVLLAILAALAVYFGVVISQSPQGDTGSHDVTYDYSGWGMATDTAASIVFRYPSRLPTTYITVIDWPPKVETSNAPYACSAAGLEVQSAGRTLPVAINGHSYCVTRESEGAAGSIYTNYAYAMPHGKGILILTWSTRVVQCENYPDPQMSACAAERQAFSMDPIADQILQSVMGIKASR